jgi:uncharacterized membrane protein
MFSTMTWSQIVLAGVFIFMGVLHFVVPKPFDAIMPKFIPRAYRRPLTLISGFFELLGGVGVVVPVTRPWAGVGLVLLLIAVFPANVQMLLSARAAHAPAGRQAGLWIRLPLQVLLVWWVWTATGARMA